MSIIIQNISPEGAPIEAQLEERDALIAALRDCLAHMKTAGSPRAVEAAEAARKLLDGSHPPSHRPRRC